MTIETETPRGHVVVVTLHSWGHAKCACTLIAKIVRQRPVYATFLVASITVERANKEIDSQFLPGVEDNLRKLIRVIPLEIGPNLYDLSSLIALDESFTKVYTKLVEGTSDAVCAPGPPQLVLLDFLLYSIFQRIKTISGHAVPVYGLETSSIAAGHMMLGPGGRVPRVVEELKRHTFKDEGAKSEAADKLFRRADGKLYAIPGIPQMYDHEQMPQKPTLPKGIAVFLENIVKVREECDGLVANATALLEGEAIRASQEWLGEKPIICLGPFDYPIVESPKAVDKSTEDVFDFLDSMVKKYGEASVIYISFGSQFWPSEPEKLWAILDILLESKTPFIFSHASPFAVVPDEIKDKIEASGVGYSSNWLPQTAILNHKACGWFPTHAGQNSVMEALAAGIPMICWPFDADQPVVAANVAFVHNLGYELFEVRNGAGLRPIHRLGDWSPEGTVEAVKREFSETIVKMKGDDGATKRANTQRFRDAFAKLWAPGGENWKEIKRITDILQ